MRTCRHSVLTCHGNEIQLAVGIECDHRNHVVKASLDLIGKASCHVDLHTVKGGHGKSHRANRLCRAHNVVKLRGSQLCGKSIKLLLHRRNLILKLSCTHRDIVDVLRLELVCGLSKKRVLFLHQLEHAETRHRLNTANTCRHGGLGHDLKQTDLARIRAMRTAAKLGGEVSHLDHTNDLAVLLAKQRHSAVLLCGLKVGLHSINADCGKNVRVDQGLDLGDLLCTHRREMRKVKAANAFVYVRACLLHVVTKHRTKRRLKQVRRRVIASNGATANVGNIRHHRVANRKAAVDHGAKVNINTVGFLGVVNVEKLALSVHGALVADLTAALAVEGGAIKNDGAVALGHRLHRRIVCKNCKNLGLGAILGITRKFGFGKICQKPLGGLAPAADVGSRLTRTGLLLLHQLVDGILIDMKMALLCDLTGEIDGESKGIVKLEYLLARDGVSLAVDRTANEVGKDRKTCVNGRIKALLLHGEHLLNIVSLGLKLGICATALANGNPHHVQKEGVVNAEKLTVTASAANDTAKHVAASLVGGDHAVRDHKHGATNMVRNDTDRNVVLGIGSVGLAGNAANGINHLADRIDLKHIVHALHDAGETLKTHTRIDVLLYKLGIVAVSVVVKLRENVVPDLHVTIALTAGLAVRRATAVLFTAVKVDLRAGTAGTCAVFPEVVGLAKSYDMLLGNADDVTPQRIRLLVLLVDRGPKKVLGNFKRLRQKLPCPRNSLVLEVIAKGEVAKHLKEGAVTRSKPDAVKVGGTDTLLAGRHAAAWRLLLTSKVFLHGRQARVDQKE